MNLARLGCLDLPTMLLAALMPCSDCSANTVHVYLLGGQSNADGRGSTSQLALALQQPHADVGYIFHTEISQNPLDSTLTTLRTGTSKTYQFGPEVTFGRAMRDYLISQPSQKADRIAIIKYANGTSDLAAQWSSDGLAGPLADGEEYTQFQQTVATGLAALEQQFPRSEIRSKMIRRYCSLSTCWALQTAA